MRWQRKRYILNIKLWNACTLQHRKYGCPNVLILIIFNACAKLQLSLAETFLLMLHQGNILQASCGAARDKRSGHDQKASPSQATSKQCQSLKPGGLPPRTVDIQNSEAKIAALLDNASMHDSGSSLKEALGLKARLQEGQQAQQTRIPDSIDTKPVQE